MYKYRDVWKEGIYKYPFTRGRITPVFDQIEPGSNILDIGCNSGGFMEMLAEKKHCKVTGVDYADNMVALARSKKLKVYKASAEKLPFKDGQFDVVCLMETIVYIDDMDKAFKEIKRVLKPNGLLIGSTPHSNTSRYLWGDKIKHHNHFDTHTLQRLLELNFKDVKIKEVKGEAINGLDGDNHLRNKPICLLFKAGERVTGWESTLTPDKFRIFFQPTINAGTVYFRMTCFAEKMRANSGIELAMTNWTPKNDNYSEWEYNINSIVRKQIEDLIRVADVSVFQIAHTADTVNLLAEMKQKYNKPMFVELDDCYFDVPSYNIASNAYKPGTPAEDYIWEQIKISDGIICSTEWLKKHLGHFFPKKPIFVVPNGIDFDVYDKAKKGEKHDKIRIGFSGASSHGNNLKVIKDVIVRILNENKNVEFYCWPPQEPFIEKSAKLKSIHPRIKFVTKWVDVNKYPLELAKLNFDIGVAPLEDNNFNRAKSNLRVIQYMALKIPVVASNVGNYKETLAGLCITEEDWYRLLKALIHNKEHHGTKNLRKSISSVNYQWVKNMYNLETIAVDYVEILKKFVKDYYRDKNTVRNRNQQVVERHRSDPLVTYCY